MQSYKTKVNNSKRDFIIAEITWFIRMFKFYIVQLICTRLYAYAYGRSTIDLVWLLENMFEIYFVNPKIYFLANSETS